MPSVDEKLAQIEAILNRIEKMLAEMRRDLQRVAGKTFAG